MYGPTGNQLVLFPSGLYFKCIISTGVSENNVADSITRVFNSLHNHPPSAPKQWRKCDRLDRKNSYLFFEILTHVALDLDNSRVNNSRSVLK